MRRRSFLHLVALCLAFVPLSLPTNAPAASDYRISGPAVHENLAIYLVHGSSRAGPVPLTLEEALAKGVARVHETGSVNQLDIENLGGDEIFVQSGDMVKGGQQDRVLTVSLLLPPRSGRIAIASFCVEQGRWAARGKEDVKTFSSASTAVPSLGAKIAMKAPPAPSRTTARVDDTTGTRQTEVWKNVEGFQHKLSDNVGAPVAAPQSQTSLQLALENKKLRDAQTTYVKALQPAGEKEDNVIGYVFAVNGKLNSADIYPSNGLFRKMWPKLLASNATEAISERNLKSAGDLPSTEQVMAFLDAAERGTSSEKPLTETMRMETREGDRAYLFETRPAMPAAAGTFVHRNYLAR
jgi:hypothetical protein